MNSCTTILTVCAVVTLLAPGVFGIECYTNGGTDRETGCEYCLFSNTTLSGLGQHGSKLLYICLTELLYDGETLDPSLVNQCVDIKKNDLVATGEEQLYVCDTNLCNAHCDGTRVGLGIVVVFSTLIAALLCI